MLLSLPMTTVSVSQPGASPSQLEAEVTRKVEDAVATIPGIKRVMSSVDEGMSTTMLEFHMDTELGQALDDTRDAVSRIRMDLPHNFQGCFKAGGFLRIHGQRYIGICGAP